MVRESNFSSEIVKSMNHYLKGSFIIKMPSMYIAGGTLDIIGCLNRGRFFAGESKIVLKLPKNEDHYVLKYGFTKIQELRAKQISKAGGIVLGFICIRPLMMTIILKDYQITRDFNLKKRDLLEYPYIKRDKSTGLWKVDEIMQL